MAADFIINHIEGAEHDCRDSGSGTARNLKSVHRVPGYTGSGQLGIQREILSEMKGEQREVMSTGCSS